MLDDVTAFVDPEQGEVDTIKAVGLERKDSEVLGNYRPDTGDVSKLKMRDSKPAAYPVLKERRVLILRCTLVAARRSEPRGWMAAAWYFGVVGDLWHLRITFESSAEIYNRWRCEVRRLNWPWRTGTNTEAVGRNTWPTG